MPALELVRRIREQPQLVGTPSFVMRMAAQDEEPLPSDLAPGKIVAKSKGLGPIADSVSSQLEGSNFERAHPDR
jgi:hypothetical protein